MLQQSQGAVEIVSSEACEHHMLFLPKGYQKHLVGSCNIDNLAVTPLRIAAIAHGSCRRRQGRGTNLDVWWYENLLAACHRRSGTSEALC